MRRNVQDSGTSNVVRNQQIQDEIDRLFEELCRKKSNENTNRCSEDLPLANRYKIRSDLAKCRPDSVSNKSVRHSLTDHAGLTKNILRKNKETKNNLCLSDVRPNVVHHDHSNERKSDRNLATNQAILKWDNKSVVHRRVTDRLTSSLTEHNYDSDGSDKSGIVYRRNTQRSSQNVSKAVRSNERKSDMIKPVKSSPNSAPAMIKPIKSSQHSAPSMIKPVKSSPNSAPPMIKPVKSSQHSAPAMIKPIKSSPHSATSMIKPVKSSPHSVPSMIKPVKSSPHSAPSMMKPVKSSLHSTPSIMDTTPAISAVHASSNVFPSTNILGSPITSTSSISRRVFTSQKVVTSQQASVSSSVSPSSRRKSFLRTSSPKVSTFTGNTLDSAVRELTMSDSDEKVLFWREHYMQLMENTDSLCPRNTEYQLGSKQPGVDNMEGRIQDVQFVGAEKLVKVQNIVTSNMPEMCQYMSEKRPVRDQVSCLPLCGNRDKIRTGSTSGNQFIKTITHLLPRQNRSSETVGHSPSSGTAVAKSLNTTFVIRSETVESCSKSPSKLKVKQIESLERKLKLPSPKKKLKSSNKFQQVTTGSIESSTKIQGNEDKSENNCSRVPHQAMYDLHGGACSDSGITSTSHESLNGLVDVSVEKLSVGEEGYESDCSAKSGVAYRSCIPRRRSPGSEKTKATNRAKEKVQKTALSLSRSKRLEGTSKTKQIVTKSKVSKTSSAGNVSHMKNNVKHIPSRTESSEPWKVKVIPVKRKSYTKSANQEKRQRLSEIELSIIQVEQTAVAESPISEVTECMFKQVSGKTSEMEMSTHVMVQMNSLQSLQHLESKTACSDMHVMPGSELFVEKPLSGRQTRSSQGLENLFQSGTHAGGIWQSIFCETS